MKLDELKSLIDQTNLTLEPTLDNAESHFLIGNRYVSTDEVALVNSDKSVTDIQDAVVSAVINRILKLKAEYETEIDIVDCYDRYDDGYLQALEDVLDELR